MALTVEIDHPEFEKDVEFDLAGVLIKNKGKAELTEEQERLLVAKRQKPAKEVLAGNQFVKVTGSSTLSAKDLEGIIVERNFGHDAAEVAAGEENPDLAVVGEDAEGSDG
jgi:hypothetical protein